MSFFWASMIRRSSTASPTSSTRNGLRSSVPKRSLFIGGEDQAHVIRDRARSGMPYIGSSAGSIITSPTIRTTNDMPIVEPPSLASLGLLAFQLNCHYLDTDPNSTFKGETREQRLLEFHEENSTP